MLNQRKSWTSQEDQLLTRLYEENKEKILNQTLHWNFIAQKLNQYQIVPKRSGKQCRERYNSFNMAFRWFNQLNPEIIKNNLWTLQDKKTLIQLHDLYGNRWAFIARNFPGRTDNCIKNYMNSTLRKGLRLLNLFVSKNRKFKQFKFKNLKEYKVDLVNKILFFSGSKNPGTQFEQDFLLSTFSSLNKQQILAEVYRLAADIKSRLMWIQNEIQEDLEDLGARTSYRPILCFEELIEKIHEMNGICKKRKQKKSRNESFRWKKTYWKQSDSQLASFNFHSGPFPNSPHLFTHQSQIQQFRQLCPLDITEGDKINASNSLKIQKTQLNPAISPEMDNVRPLQQTFKLNLQQTQNNGRDRFGETRRQSGPDNSVILKRSKSFEFNKGLEITANEYLPNNPERTSMQFIELITAQPKKPTQQQSKKSIDFKTLPSISSMGDKSKQSSPSDTQNLEYESGSQMDDDYDYLVFSEYIDDNNYLPLYPSYRNANNQHQNNGYHVADYISMNDEQGSEQEAI